MSDVFSSTHPSMRRKMWPMWSLPVWSLPAWSLPVVFSVEVVEGSVDGEAARLEPLQHLAQPQTLVEAALSTWRALDIHTHTHTHTHTRANTRTQ